MSQKLDKQNQGFGKTNPWVGMIFFIVLFLLIIIAVSNLSPHPEQITWQDFKKDMLEKKAVDRVVVINKETVQVYIKKEFANDSAFSKVLKTSFGTSAGRSLCF